MRARGTSHSHFQSGPCAAIPYQTKSGLKSDFLLQGSTQTFSKQGLKCLSFPSGSSALFSARQLSALLEAEKQSFHRVSGPAIPVVEPEAEGNGEGKFCDQEVYEGDTSLQEICYGKSFGPHQKRSLSPCFTDDNTKAQRSYLASSPGHKAY